jgi:serine phosphatase RsbU (regulator of sigma subunit)
LAVLQVSRGATPGTVHELHVERTVLGRHPNCHVVFDNGAISRHHAQILESHGSYYIEDLRSRNGTYLNGQPLESRTELHDGDQIRLCDITLVFAEHGSSLQNSSSARSTFVDAETSLSERDTGEHDPLDDSAVVSRPAEPEEESSNDFESSSVLSKINARQSGEVGSGALAETKLKAILEITRALGLELQVDAVLPKMLSALFNIFPQAAQGFVLLKDPDSGKLLVKATKLRKGKEADAVAVSMTVVREAMESGEALLSANVRDDSRFRESTSLTKMRIHSMMCVPLVGHDGEAFGVIQIVTRGEKNVFDKGDLELLVSVAAQAARAVENATLHEEVVRQRELERDLEFATQVQLGFLPKSRPRMDQYAFADYYDAAQRIGGDYFDYIELPDGRVAITIGDVAGKGMPAALLMARLYSSTRFQLLTHSDLPAAVSGLNAEMASSGLGHRFITFLVMVIDPPTHRVALVNAGHLSPLIRRRDGTVTEVGRSDSSLPLGILPDLECRESHFDLAPGELVITYTDGVTEAMNDRREIYGRKRLEACISDSPASIDEQVKAVISDVEDFVGESTSRDDTCIVGFQRLPA